MISVPCVINADDLGMNDEVNEAIFAAFKQGLLSSASLMTNMPGFPEASKRIVMDKLSAKIGVHLNLSEGRALSDHINNESRLTEDGCMFPQDFTSLMRLTKSNLYAVEREWECQILRCKASGITPSHLDSHHHIHVVWPLLSIALRLARRHNIPHVRLSRNIGRWPGVPKHIYKLAINNRIRRSGQSRTAYFGSAHDVKLSRKTELVGPLEIMVHPIIKSNCLTDVVTGDTAQYYDLAELIGSLEIQRPFLSFAEL